MNNITVLISAVLAVTTILTAGLTVLPSTVQDAQANPCSAESAATLVSSDNEGAGAGTQTVTTSPIQVDDQNCKFIGNIDIDEDADTNIDLD
jgi:hypothetical protein